MGTGRERDEDVQCPHCGIKQYYDNPQADPALASMAALCWKCTKPLSEKG